MGPAFPAGNTSFWGIRGCKKKWTPCHLVTVSGRGSPRRQLSQYLVVFTSNQQSKPSPMDRTGVESKIRTGGDT